jgi:lipopolysaccharide biosynthesis protein
LIHDIHVRDPNFGVYDFWQEIKHSFKHIEFFHGFGLGVLFVGENKYSKLVKEFNFHTNEFVAIFETLGARYLKNIEIMNFQVKSSLESELNFMKNSSIWKVTLPFRQLKWGISWIILYINLNLFPKSQPNKVRNSGYKLEESKSQIAKIGVIFHIYYQDEILEVVRNLKFIDAPFDLYVTAHNPINESIFAQLEQMQQIKVNYFENKGRDILPFILMFQKYNLYKYNLILKIHTKKSHWISTAYTNSLGYFNGQAWSKSLLKDLLGSTRNCFEIFKIFEDKAKIGILASKDSTLLLKNAFGENKQDFSKLIRTLGIRFFPIFSKFPAGSMYWFRPEIFSQDLIEKITSLTFQDELGQVDGTMSHAIERVIGVLAHQSRFLLVEHKFESNDELHRKVNW